MCRYRFFIPSSNNNLRLNNKLLPTSVDSYSNWPRAAAWSIDSPLSESKIPPALRSLVTDRGSLTQALQLIDANSFEVRVLCQRLARPYFHEQLKLGRKLEHAALIREVELCLFGMAVVYARSIIPLGLLRQGQRGLAGLGKKPLGEVLFSGGNIRVSKREYLFFDLNGQLQVARRTPYDYQDHTILVSEFFLPSLESLV